MFGRRGVCLESMLLVLVPSLGLTMGHRYFFLEILKLILVVLPFTNDMVFMA